MKNFRCFTAIFLIATMFIGFSACSSDDDDDANRNNNGAEFVDEDITAHFDSEFAKALQNRGYIPNLNKIKRSDVNKITSLDVELLTISSIAGIEYFEALTFLNCSRNSLTALDISKNTKLTELNCSINHLTSLDVNNNASLTFLNCADNQLTNLDVNNNALIYLYCYDNQIASLDISKNTVLTSLSCTNNQLTNLDVSKNTALMGLWCYNNQLRTLDVSKNTKLGTLDCYNNPGNGTKFIVTAWFSNANIPYHFTSAVWSCNDRPISIEYQKAN